MARKKPVTDINKLKSGDLYQPPIGEPVKVGRVTKVAKGLKAGDVFIDADGNRTFIRDVHTPTAEENILAGKALRTTSKKEKEEILSGKKPKSKRKRKKKEEKEPKEGEEPRRRSTRQKLVEDKDWRPPQRKGHFGVVPPRKSRAKPKEEHEGRKAPKEGFREITGEEEKPQRDKSPRYYVMCPLCGWWHIEKYALKKSDKRDVTVDRTLNPYMEDASGTLILSGGRPGFRIRLDGNPNVTATDDDPNPPKSIRHARKLAGAGRGSKNATVTISDLQTVDDLPDWLVKAVLEQLNYIHLVLSANKGDRLAVAEKYRPGGSVSKKAPKYRAKLPKKRGGEEAKVEEEPTVTEPSQPEETLPVVYKGTRTPVSAAESFPMNDPVGWIYYSREAAERLLQYARLLRSVNVTDPTKQIPPDVDPGDIKNWTVFVAYAKICGLLENWAENFKIEDAVTGGEKYAGSERIGRLLDNIKRQLGMGDEPPSESAKESEWVKWRRAKADFPKPNLSLMVENLEKLVALGGESGLQIPEETTEELVVELRLLRKDIEELKDELAELDQQPYLGPIEESRRLSLQYSLRMKVGTGLSIIARLADAGVSIDELRRFFQANQ